jgi:hypothetical protein
MKVMDNCLSDNVKKESCRFAVEPVRETAKGDQSVQVDPTAMEAQNRFLQILEGLFLLQLYSVVLHSIALLMGYLKYFESNSIRPSVGRQITQKYQDGATCAESVDLTAERLKLNS